MEPAISGALSPTPTRLHFNGAVQHVSETVPPGERGGTSLTADSVAVHRPDTPALRLSQSAPACFLQLQRMQQAAATPFVQRQTQAPVAASPAPMRQLPSKPRMPHGVLGNRGQGLRAIPVTSRIHRSHVASTVARLQSLGRHWEV